MIILAIFLSSLWNLTINQAASQNIAQFFKDRLSSVTCETGEVCHIDLLSIAMCTCPGQKPCSKDFAKEIRGAEYKFCESMDHLPNCSRGQVYSVHKGIRQILKCVCPFPMEQQPIAYNVVEGWIKYKCDEPQMCDEGDTCRVRKRVPGVGGQIDSTLLINQCRCRPGSQCLEINRRQKRRIEPSAAASSIRRGRKTQQHVFGSARRDSIVANPEAQLFSLEKMFKSRHVKKNDDDGDDFGTPLNDKLSRWTFNDRMSPNDNAKQTTSDQSVETVDEPFHCVSEVDDGDNNADVR